MLNEEGVACSGVVSDSRRAFTLNHSDRSTHLVDRASDAVYVLIDDGGFSQWPYLLSLPEPLQVEEPYCLHFETCEAPPGILHCTLIVRCVMAACNWSGLALDDTPRIFSSVFHKVFDCE